MELYDKTIKDQLAKGGIELTPEDTKGNEIHYIPHHCVVKSDSATTKLRVVYHASAKSSKTDISLNESMYAGPILLEDLCGLLMQFRQKPIGVTSDIEKAFLQICINQMDRDVTRFLWVKDTSCPPIKMNLIIYRFMRVLFWVIESPYMLAGTIHYHMSQLGTTTAKTILRNCYVDNVITGANSVSNAKTFYAESKDAFRMASMNLREWYSNSSEFLDSIPVQDRGTSRTPSVLGLKWNLDDDTISCHFKATASKCTTKRQMLRIIAQLVDPCGFLIPVTIVGKIFLQKLWELKVDWDVPVAIELQKQWDCFAVNLERAPTVSISRHVGHVPDASTELNCFTDTSRAAYAAVVYQRNEAKSTISSDLLFAKVKVTPLKDQKLTIPKLELTAVALGCRIATYIRKQLEFCDCRIYLWTDSQCALHWVLSNTQSPVYVKNRVEQIKNTENVCFRYVPTSCNPAAMPTKGVNVEELRNRNLWWKGPEWLVCDQTKWPKMPDTLEMKSAQNASCQDSVTSADCLIETTGVLFPLDMSRYSSLQFLVRVLAWVMRFGLRSKHAAEHYQTVITAAERAQCLRILIKHAQSQFVIENPREFAQALKQLNFFVDPTGLIRCHGRIHSAIVAYDVCFPIFIPRQSSLCRLLILDRHQAWGHAGLQHTLSDVRTKFWVPKGRSTVKSIIQSCTVCKVAHTQHQIHHRYRHSE